MMDTLLPTNLRPGALIFRGILSIIVGVLALIWPGPSLVAITLLFGAYAFVDGVSILAAGWRLGKQWLPMLQGILGINIGVVTVLWPGITLYVLTLMVGLWAVVTGILELVYGFKMKRPLLGIVGLLSIALGVAIFAVPGLGALTLLSLVASYALLSGALLIALGIALRRQPTVIQIPSGS